MLYTHKRRFAHLPQGLLYSSQ